MEYNKEEDWEFGQPIDINIDGKKQTRMYIGRGADGSVAVRDEKGNGTIDFINPKDVITEPILHYDPSFGDDKICACGHSYYRHFDSWDNQSPVGCKYCGCLRWHAQATIADFFLNDSSDHKGRTLEDYLCFSDDEWEACHNHVQWAFPLHERSYHAEVSPIVTEADAQRFQSSHIAQKNIGRLYVRFCQFLGILEFTDEKKQKWWCHDGNHNLLRITRIIRSLRLFGLNNLAHELYEEVTRIGTKYQLSEITFKYWEDAVNAPLFSSMTKRFLDQKMINIGMEGNT